ncbi:WXG100 family type VII secretion target [Nocardia fusca]|uniref:WXG100 family type VII secretion target n=1 Tax=Nocardia fusca TaxID=941183 RepID=UPI0037C8D38E
MSMPIFTDRGEIETALTQSKTVVSALQDNLTELSRMRDELMDKFEGSGATIYKEVADQLGSRLDRFSTSITDLDKSTNQAATLIGDADTAVAGMFQNLL